MSKFSELGNDLYTGKRSFDFIGKRKVFYVIAIAMIALAVILPIARGGFNFGIEFRGGSEFRVTGVSQTSDQTAIAAVKSIVPAANPLVTGVGADGLRIQTDKLTDTQSESVRQALASAYKLQGNQVASSFVGANWGADYR